MSTKTTISITEARKRIFDIADEVQRPGSVYTLTDKGRPKAAVISAEEYDSLMETIEILSDPKALKRIEQAEKELANGDFVSWDDFKKEWGYTSDVGHMVLADKGAKKYKVKSKKKKR